MFDHISLIEYWKALGLNHIFKNLLFIVYGLFLVLLICYKILKAFSLFLFYLFILSSQRVFSLTHHNYLLKYFFDK